MQLIWKLMQSLLKGELDNKYALSQESFVNKWTA